MYRIVSKEQFSEKVFRLRVEAPLIAKAYRAGNFVIIRVGEKGERIPLTIAHADAEKKTELCHTLNGSALALPRIVAALLENNQTPEGIRIPKALVPYCGFEIID